MLLLAAVLFGTTGTARALGSGGASPLAVGALRITLGGVLLLGLAAATRAPLRRCLEREVRGAVLVGVAAVATYQLSFFAAVSLSGVAVGTLVTIGSAPVLAGLFGIVGGERPTRTWVLATMLATGGCGLLLIPTGETDVRLAGTLLALVAGASYAALTVAGRRVMLHTKSPDAVMAVFFGGGALLLLPLLAIQDLRPLTSWRGVAMVVWLGLVTTALAYWLFARGLARLSAATATTLDLAEPLTAALLGVLLLSERLSSRGLLGAGLIAGGLLLLTLRPPAGAVDADDEGEQHATMGSGWR
ncbi:EamA family transporter [Candidatus Nephthysia bennettiae]|uniref:DMT family transporter n=1 Tax=Candidatus Nephthysia bennettiae TaxID=3127016 RepID=UPI0030C7511E